MKLNKLIYFLPLAIILIVTGCSKDKFNINRNINNPTDSTVTYDVILPAALHATGTIVASQWGPIQNWMGYWARSGTYAPNVVEETYQITTTFGNGIWNNCYDNNYDYQIMENKAKVAGAGFYEGIARIMKAHNFQILVDVYGNVPYKEALRGNLNPTPKYDNGLDIYKDLLRQIDTGIALIKDAEVTATNPNKNIWLNDIMFGDAVSGDISLVPDMKMKWAQFGNTLKLRMLIHAYAVAGMDHATEFNKILNLEIDGNLVGFLGADDDADVQPGYKSDKPNPYYATFKADATGSQTALNVYYRANSWGIGYYGYDGDPRLSLLYENGTKGVAYGLPPVNENAATNLAAVGPGLYKSSGAPQIILSAAESFFLQAEARERGFITTGPTAAVLTVEGMYESFKYLQKGIGSWDPADGLAFYLDYNAGYADVDYSAAPYDVGYPAGGLYTILSQKWFALNGINTLEVWTDYRRVPYSSVSTQPGAPTTHFVYGDGVGFTPGPPISVSPQNTETRIPVRYLYPQSEYNYNAANVGGEGVVNQFTSRIFWDIN